MIPNVNKFINNYKVFFDVNIKIFLPPRWTVLFTQTLKFHQTNFITRLHGWLRFSAVPQCFQFKWNQTEQGKEPVVQEIYRERIMPVPGEMQVRTWISWVTKKLAVELKVQDKGVRYFRERRVLHLRGEVQLHSQQGVWKGGRGGDWHGVCGDEGQEKFKANADSAIMNFYIDIF